MPGKCAAPPAPAMMTCGERVEWEWEWEREREWEWEWEEGEESEQEQKGRGGVRVQGLELMV